MAATVGLKTDIKHRLLNTIRTHAPDGRYVVLVVDPNTARVLSSCCRNHEVTDAGAVVLANLYVKRERVKMEAVYFLEPTQSSLKKLMADFQDETKLQYSKAHLYFTSRLTSDDRDMLKSVPALAEAAAAAQSLAIDFIAMEQRVFSFGRSTAFSDLYLPITNSEYSEEIQRSAKQLASVALTMNEYPLIRYRKDSEKCRALAMQTDLEIQNAFRSLKDWSPARANQGVLLITDRAADPVAPLMHEFTYQALINEIMPVEGEIINVNWIADPKKAVAEPSNAAAKKAKEQKEAKERKDAEDKLKAEQDSCCFWLCGPSAEAAKALEPKKESKDVGVVDTKKEQPDNIVIVSDEDPLWVAMRHQHIGIVQQEVVKRLKEFSATSAVVKMGQKAKQDVTVNDMVRAMKELGDYQSASKQFSKHLTLATECGKQVQAQRYQELAGVEQDIACMVNEDSEMIDRSAIIQAMIAVCQNPQYSAVQKLRLILIYYIAQGPMQESTRAQLMAGIDERLQKALLNIEKLGVQFAYDATRAREANIPKGRIAEFKKNAETSQLRGMRFSPALKGLLRQYLRGELSGTDFPYLKPPAEEPVAEAPKQQDAPAAAAAGGGGGGGGRSRGASAPSWRQKKNSMDDDAKDRAFAAAAKKDKPKDDNRTRFIVFVLGGMTFSEMRSTYEVGKEFDANLTIGSQQTLTFRQYIASLAEMPDDADLEHPALTKRQKESADAKDGKAADGKNGDKKGDAKGDAKGKGDDKKGAAAAGAGAGKKPDAKPAAAAKPHKDDDLSDDDDDHDRKRATDKKFMSAKFN